MTRLRRASVMLALVVATFVAALAVSTLASLVVGGLGEWIEGPGTPSSPSILELPVRPLNEWPRTMSSLVRAMFVGDVAGFTSLGVALLVVAAPALIAAPALRPTPPEHGGRSLAWSVAGAAALGGACALGVLATLWDMVGLMMVAAPEEPAQALRGGNVIYPWLLAPAWLLAGIAWAWAFARAGRAHAPDRLDRMVRWLVAGTCVELAIAAPTFVAAARRDTCWCSWGSWWAIVAGITTLTVLCGPALVLMATRRTRLAWMRAVCAECGYRRHGTQERCPECGTAFAGLSAAGAPGTGQ
jgi:hypothetical protein